MRASSNCLGIISFLTFLLGSISGQENQICANFTVTPLRPFFMPQILGTWYPIQRYPRLPENVQPLPYRCLTHGIHHVGSVVPYALDTSFQNLTGEGIIDYNYYLFPDVSTPTYAHWLLTPDDISIEEYVDMIYLHTDYDNFGIQYVCTNKDNYRYEEMIILTRERHPSQAYIDELKAIVESYGYSKEHALTVDQTNCTEA